MSDNWSDRWHDAACINHDPEWWDFPSNHQRQAVTICNACPLKVECLTYALETNEPHLIWAGLTPLERKALKLR